MTAREARAIATLHRVRAAALRAIRDDGKVLHFDAPAATATRHTDALPALRGTVGRVAGVLGPERWGVYTYGPRGTSDEYDAPEETVRAICRRLGPARIGALQAALRRAYADEIAEEEEQRDRERSRRAGEARLIRTGERLRSDFGHRPGIVGPLFGPSGSGQ